MRPSPLRVRMAQLLVENVQPRPGRRGWHGGPTPVGAIRGLPAAAAAWIPAPGRKSIWQLTLHVAYWNYAVRNRLEEAVSDDRGPRRRFPRRPANWPEMPAVADGRAWQADSALLRAEHARLLRAIASVPVNRYSEKPPGGRRWTMGELILGIAQHDAYHAGQIQLVKRLWSAASKHAGSGLRRARPGK
jgi:hypothetical protein